MTAHKLIFVLIASCIFDFVRSSDSIKEFIQRFEYTGEVQYFKIPKGVHSVDVEIAGAGGGDDECEANKKWLGGKGHSIQAKIDIPVGNDELYIYVGGAGNGRISSECNKGIIKKGGFNGGGDSGRHFGAAGGGSSDIRTHHNDPASRLIVAAGGAGGSSLCQYEGNFQLL